MAADHDGRRQPCDEATPQPPHTPPPPKPTVNIDHIGPVDDPDAWVRRSAASNTAVVAS